MEKGTYDKIQKEIVNDKRFHCDLAELINEGREKQIKIYAEKETLLQKMYANEMILHTGNNKKSAEEISNYVEKGINEFENLFEIEKRLGNLVRENKYNFAIANQN